MSVSALLPRIASCLRGLRGFRRVLFAFASGAVSALAFAPFGMFPLLLLSLGVLILLLDGAQDDARPIWRSAVIGWAYGFGQFLAGLYWVAYAFLVDPVAHAWQIPLVAILLPGGLALFIAGACAASAALWREGYTRVFAFAACYSIAEWLRGHLLTGFPWNVAGYGWGESLSILQSASLIGIYGLTLLTILFGGSLALLCDRNRRSVLIPVTMVLLFASLWGFGAVRLAATPLKTVPGVHLRIVQPNVPQEEKYVPALRAVHWRELVQLSAAKAKTAPTYIIWPEAAPPFMLAGQPEALDDIAILTGQDKTLITGAVRAENDGNGNFVAHNSVYIFGNGGRLLAVYDKFHLVPFGEYMPLSDVFHALGLNKIVNQPGNFASGDGPHTYAVPGGPAVGLLICYEILFPGAVVDEANRPSWLVNVTDDSWFGPASSSGPYQHLLVARVRAIEEGLPVVRSANTGISAIIDPMGRMRNELPVDTMGTIDAGLPTALQPTLYGRIGDWLFLLLLTILLAIVAAEHVRRAR